MNAGDYIIRRIITQVSDNAALHNEQKYLILKIVKNTIYVAFNAGYIPGYMRDKAYDYDVLLSDGYNIEDTELITGSGENVYKRIDNTETYRIVAREYQWKDHVAILPYTVESYNWYTDCETLKGDLHIDYDGFSEAVQSYPDGTDDIIFESRFDGYFRPVANGDLNEHNLYYISVDNRTTTKKAKGRPK